MRRVTKFYRSRTQSSEETSEPPTVEPQSELPVEPQQSKSEQWNFELLSAKRQNNAFSVTKARFLPDDELHTVIISFDKEGGTKMTLKVDDETIYEVNTEGKLRGSAELDIIGLVVDFSWDLVRIPLKFAFRTREFSFHAKPVGSGSSSSSSHSGQDGKQQMDVKHVYLLEIFAV